MLVKLALHAKHQSNTFKQEGFDSKLSRHIVEGDMDPIEPTSLVDDSENQEHRNQDVKRELFKQILPRTMQRLNSTSSLVKPEEEAKEESK